jgi:hypothetical protein
MEGEKKESNSTELAPHSDGPKKKMDGRDVKEPNDSGEDIILC